MSTALGLPAFGTTFSMGDGASPEVFTTIAHVGDVAFGLNATTVDVTAMDSGQPWTQMLATIMNGGPASFPLFFLPDNTGHKLLLTKMVARGQGTAGVPINFKITFPDAVTWPFSGFITDFSIKAAVKGVVTADVKITVTGQVVFPA